MGLAYGADCLATAAHAQSRSPSAGQGISSSAETLPAITSTSDADGTAAPVGLNLSTPNRSGSRLDLTPFETPASIEIIPGQKIRDRGQNTVNEAVTQNATGITTLGTPGNGFSSFTSRGFAGVNSVMNLYDGTRLYVASGTITFPFDTWNVDRIEVLRGPASLLYGEGAIGGVVNVVPKKPTFVRLNEARVAIDTNLTRRAAIDSGGAISDNVAYRLNVSANQSDGWLRQNGDFSNAAISAALLWKVTPELAVTLQHDYGFQAPLAYFGTPLINGTVPRSLRFQNYNVRDDRNLFTDNWTQLKVEWNPNENVTLRNTAYYLSSERRYRNVESYAFVPATGLVRRSDYIQILHDQDQVGNRFDATFRHGFWGMKNTFVAGFDANHIDFKHTNNSPYAGMSNVSLFNFDPGLFLNTSPTRPGFRSSTDQVSAFAEDRLEITDQLALIAGVRYEVPRVQREDLVNPANSFNRSLSALSYRFGAVYNPLPETALYVSYSTAVDPVTSLITLNVTQQAFRLSSGRQIEGGLKQTLWGGRAEFTLAGYHIEKDDLLTVDPLRPGVTIQVGSQSSTGFEASGSVEILEGLRLEGNLALLQAQYDRFDQAVAGRVVSYRGNQPTNVPEQIANAWISWAFLPRWEARVGVQHVGPTFADFANTVKRPSYTILNASLDHRITDNSKLSIRGYNLTDEIYPITGSANTWFLGPPRTVEAAYTITF
ncbi:TonB-dependent receptor [Enterovirga sp. DB1703]|uniref:TonB-dependent receptor n=2 Tax=Enterovirga aerilata TaxID=2730920 RepID=A0A849HXF7_9HYPH|nr:TonB-dependent receptor [Enterovirga sp. DB1703]NNM71792.1 TonB-dependent receptor [Enterovirga sp. DB1703]